MINAISAVITAIATVVLVCVTYKYVRLTRDVVREMEGQHKEMVHQRLMLVQPSVWGTLNRMSDISGISRWSLVIQNDGPGSAYNLRVLKKVGNDWEEIKHKPILPLGKFHNEKIDLSTNGAHDIRISCVDSVDRIYTFSCELTDSDIPIEVFLQNLN